MHHYDGLDVKGHNVTMTTRSQRNDESRASVSTELRERTATRRVRPSASQRGGAFWRAVISHPWLRGTHDDVPIIDDALMTWCDEQNRRNYSYAVTSLMMLATLGLIVAGIWWPDARWCALGAAVALICFLPLYPARLWSRWQHYAVPEELMLRIARDPRLPGWARYSFKTTLREDGRLPSFGELKPVRRRLAHERRVETVKAGGLWQALTCESSAPTTATSTDSTDAALSRSRAASVASPVTANEAVLSERPLDGAEVALAALVGAAVTAAALEDSRAQPQTDSCCARDEDQYTGGGGTFGGAGASGDWSSGSDSVDDRDTTANSDCDASLSDPGPATDDVCSADQDS
jgi:hypothetical protein